MHRRPARAQRSSRRTPVSLTVHPALSERRRVTRCTLLRLTCMKKIVAIFGTTILLLPWMLRHLTEFTERMMDKIVGLG